MGNLNLPNCTTQGSFNTGIPNGCVLTLENITGFLLAFDGFKIPAASTTDWATEIAYLQAATLATDPAERLYPVLFLEDFTDNTPAPEKKKSGFGNTTHTFEQPYDFQARLENLGIEFMKNLRSYRGRKNLRCYVVTDEMIGGYENAAGDFVPFECTFDLTQPKIGKITGDPTMYNVEISIKDPRALTDNLVGIAIPTGTDLASEINGLTDVVLSVTGGAGSVAISAIEKNTKVDFITKYATELATGMFLVNGVAKNATIANGVATISALTAGSAIVSLNTPAVLAAAGIGSSTAGGYEGNSVTVTVGEA